MNKNKLIFSGLFLLSIFLPGCVYTQQNKDAISQFSTINSLMCGLYDAEFNYARIKKCGDFGIGTFNALDGEMVALDGRFYQVKSDGSINNVTDSMKSPFCLVKFFQAGEKIQLNGERDYNGIIEKLEHSIASKNLFYAARIDGKFKYIKTRSVPRQGKPYKKLADAAKEQSVFEFKDIEGTLVGFRFPDYMSEINMAGWHFHFISRNGLAGGHVVGCVANNGTIGIDEASNFCLKLSRMDSFRDAALHKPDKQVLEKIEK